MEKLFYEATHSTPEILFNPDNGQIEIRGKSIPENAIKFFTPVINWMKDYENTPNETTKVILQIDYFNTSSSKCIMQILKILERISFHYKVEIDWVYKDEDMYDVGEDYQLLLKIPFNMIEL